MGHWQSLDFEVQDIKELNKIASTDEELQQELEGKIQAFQDRMDKEEFKVFLSGKYDKGNAVLSIYSGAGGVDAEDWTTILLRMYQRYCERKGFRTKILHQAFGEPGPEGRIGTKQAVMEIKGQFVYGFLKGENGVHRLVRISPFSAKKLRHTSFALVEVLPEISKVEAKAIEIKPEDIRVDTFRASGPGGQYVNKRDSAIRITHLPTKIVVSSQNERLQGLNKETAMKLLRAKLYQLEKSKKEKELSTIKGGADSIEWGSQIRSYVLHPYKMIKDYRTKIETSKTEAVLDGDLDEFIEAEIRII